MQFICGEFDVSAYEAAVRGEGGGMDRIDLQRGSAFRKRENRFFIEGKKKGKRGIIKLMIRR